MGKKVDAVSEMNYRLFVEPNLAKKQAEVLAVFDMGGNDRILTSEEVAKEMGKPLNAISGRITELCRMGKLLKHDRTRNANGSSCWRFRTVK